MSALQGFRPMLAATYAADHQKFPALASPKIDGIRALKAPPNSESYGPLFSRTLKPIPNRFIQETLRHLPWGLDGELLVPGGFQVTTSGVMSQDGRPAFAFHVFDDFSEPQLGFAQRLANAQRKVEQFASAYVSIVPHHKVETPEELLEREAAALAQGFEGLMLRAPGAAYKFGRSTAREGGLVKVKRFATSEALVLRKVALERNHNEQELDHLGLSKRSSSQEGKVAVELLGALLCIDLHTHQVFSCGSGFTAIQREGYWKAQALPRVILYKSLPQGVLNAPRHPIFLGFRSPDDLPDYDMLVHRAFRAASAQRC